MKRQKNKKVQRYKKTKKSTRIITLQSLVYKDVFRKHTKGVAKKMIQTGFWRAV